MHWLILVQALTSIALASPLHPRDDTNSTSHVTDTISGSSTAYPTAQSSSNGTASGSASLPKVTIYPAKTNSTNGQGVELYGNSSNGIDTYYGIPFAAPPVGDLRFAAPQNVSWNDTTTYNATSPKPVCLQAQDPRYTSLAGMSEDCLYLNVQVPKGANNASIKTPLPVMVWVYGGSFVSGGSTFYDGSVMITQGEQTNRSFVYVSLNYRLGILGFGYGEEIAQNNAANLGIKDLTKALQWVQDNIQAWGGDPDQVTVFGQSAGAIMISLLYLQPNMTLFKSAIMESGAQSTAPIGPTGSTWQAPYNALVQFAGCGNSSATGSGNMTTNATMTMSMAMSGNSSANGTMAQGSFECLKRLPADQLLMAQEQTRNISAFSLAFIFAPSIDGDIIPDSPHALLAAGQFAKIPYISGNMEDEGTLFVPPSLPFGNETFVAIAFASVEPVIPPVLTLQELFGVVYPNIPSEGSPFGTGSETFGLEPAYKQLSAILGDAAFQANRRWFLQQSFDHSFNQTWSYTFNSAPPSTPPRLGVYHGAGIPYVYGLPQLAGLNVTFDSPVASQVASYNFTHEDVVLSRQVIDYWLNFAYFTDPNGKNNNTVASSNLTYWPSYGSDKNLIVLERSNVTSDPLATNSSTNPSVIPDTYREQKMDFFLEQPKVWNYKREVEARVVRP